MDRGSGRPGPMMGSVPHSRPVSVGACGWPVATVVGDVRLPRSERSCFGLGSSTVPDRRMCCARIVRHGASRECWGHPVPLVRPVYSAIPALRVWRNANIPNFLGGDVNKIGAVTCPGICRTRIRLRVRRCPPSDCGCQNSPASHLRATRGVCHRPVRIRDAPCDSGDRPVPQ